MTAGGDIFHCQPSFLDMKKKYEVHVRDTKAHDRWVTFIEAESEREAEEKATKGHPYAEVTEIKEK